MASVHREVILNSSIDHVWDAVRDIGALHTRLVPGFVVDTKLEQGARIVTFGNGMVVREAIIEVDEDRRRVAWAAVGSEMLSHYSASFQIFDAGGGRHARRVDRRSLAARRRARGDGDDRRGAARDGKSFRATRPCVVTSGFLAVTKSELQCRCVDGAGGRGALLTSSLRHSVTLR